MTFPRGEGFTRISVGPQTTVADLKKDWMMTHEMIHLAFPSMADSHHWIEEGIATYVEPVARVQAGQLSAADMWRHLFATCRRANRSRAIAVWTRPTPGAAPTGAERMFCLLADVQIREQTGNRMGLQDALRAILRHGGVITEDWPIERALATGDEATGTARSGKPLRANARPAPPG